jgi:hypothetical protein
MKMGSQLGSLKERIRIYFRIRGLLGISSGVSCQHWILLKCMPWPDFLHLINLRKAI